VGSGVVTDISKHACYLYENETGWHVPYVVFQTANSVSAYTSSLAPVFIQGVKRTLPSRYPEALVCDLETLRDAPPQMTVAGAGDMLAAFASLPDWYLANRLGMDDQYNRLSQELIGPLDEILLQYAQDIRVPSLTGMEVLAKLITLGGLAMSLSHATTPLSGYEHVMSHILDLINEKQDKPLPMHGSQVALTTVLACHAYQIFLEEFTPPDQPPAGCFPDADRMRTHILNAFLEVDPSGRAGEECWADYKVKLETWNREPERVSRFLSDWAVIRQELAAWTRPPQTLLHILQAIDAPCSFEALNPPAGEQEARFAFMNAPLMRKRLTLGDVLIFFGFDREALWRRIWNTVQVP
jgi:glycerol-1-phosphate dehydrogenase [NAD(P)+]